MILVSMERGDPTLYYGTKQLYFGRVIFKFIRGGNHPLRKTCYKKGLGRRGLNEGALLALLSLITRISDISLNLANLANLKPNFILY